MCYLIGNKILDMKSNSYNALGVSLTLSFVLMYTVMFLNVDDVDHIYLSLTRTYMTLLMVAPMAILMLLVMPSMYPQKRRNYLIMGSSILIFIVALVMLRTQIPVTDSQYMRAMIPHHSSAIMTSKNVDLNDPEPKKLAQNIIVSQQKEIAQMKAILERLQHESEEQVPVDK